MLNIFKLNINKVITSKHNNEVKSLKHFPSSTREWNNSIYVYNKNALNIIPVVTQSAFKLIKSYFNIYNSKLEKKIRKERLLLRLKRLSSNKIYISNGEFKHTNNKVLITLYIYNRQKHNYKIKVKKDYFKMVFKYLKNKLEKKFKLIKYFALNKLSNMNRENKMLFLLDKKTNKDISRYLNLSYKKLLKRCLVKLNRYIYYKQLLYINKSKYNYTYLQYLKKYLEKIYNKNVEFNLIDLKRFYLNSDVLSESITLKLTRNRKKTARYLNDLKNKITTNKFSILYYKLNKNKLIKNEIKNKKAFVLKNLKYKHVIGFRLEAKGRLTRRYTASRSTSKLKYKGTLMNIDSSYKGISSVLLKGNLRSNLQFTKLKSKTRIGSFGIKGWLSGN